MRFFGTLDDRQNLELNNIARRSVGGLSPTDPFWRTTIGRPNSRSRLLCPPEAGKADGNGSIRECRPLVRQNKVGGGQAPDQPRTVQPKGDAPSQSATGESIGLSEGSFDFTLYWQYWHFQISFSQPPMTASCA